MEVNVIPCTTWVKKGIAAAVPEKVELTPKELEEIIKQTQSELQDVEDDSEEDISYPETDNRPKKSSVLERDIPESDEYNFNAYDAESGNIHCSIGNIVSFGKDGTDPLITRDNDDDSEKEDDIIKTNDNLVLIGRVDGDASILEVFVYNEAEGSFYCHHDILLPSFPLCIEWLNYDSADARTGNLCAIGNMTPVIEVWDLDLMDCLEPAYKLGRKANKKKKIKRVGHKDAVLDIAWNQNYTHILASGSVDQTVLLWDLENATPATRLKSFNEKVQSIKWHPTETHHLLTGCADKLVRLFDCKEESNVKSWEVPGEVERVLWNQFDTNYCIVSTDNGYIGYIDVRGDKPVWQVLAHEKEVTGVSLSSSCPGLLVSSSNDGVVKVWDLTDDKEPSVVWEKKTNLGAIQCLAACPDNPFVFALGGDNKSHNFKVMDFTEISEVRDIFKERIPNNSSKAKQDDSDECEMKQKSNAGSEDKQEDMMDVTEDMESMILDMHSSNIKSKKKRHRK